MGNPRIDVSILDTTDGSTSDHSTMRRTFAKVVEGAREYVRANPDIVVFVEVDADGPTYVVHMVGDECVRRPMDVGTFVHMAVSCGRRAVTNGLKEVSP